MVDEDQNLQIQMSHDLLSTLGISAADSLSRRAQPFEPFPDLYEHANASLPAQDQNDGLPVTDTTIRSKLPASEQRWNVGIMRRDVLQSVTPSQPEEANITFYYEYLLYLDAGMF